MTLFSASLKTSGDCFQADTWPFESFFDPLGFDTCFACTFLVCDDSYRYHSSDVLVGTENFLQRHLACQRSASTTRVAGSLTIY